jgi:peptidoglycan/LPS O-acetylase OafA/YrhL
VPPYYLTLVVALPLRIPESRSSFFWNAAFLSNIQMVRNGEWNGPFSHLWSLAVLEQYYWIWPLVMLGFSRRMSFSVATTLVLAGPIFRTLCLVTHSNGMSWLMMPFSAWDQMSCGALLALCRGMPEDSASFKAVQFIGDRIAAPGFILILTFKLLHVAIPFGAIYVPTVAAFCFVTLIRATANGHKGMPGRFLQWEPLGIIGKASYSIFLLHGFTIFAIPHIGLLNRIVSGDLRCIVLLPGSIALGCLACRFIERPILSLREKLSLMIEVAREGRAAQLARVSQSSF